MDRSNVCQYFLMGRCRYGDNCRFYHPPQKGQSTTDYNNYSYKTTSTTNNTSSAKFCVGEGSKKIWLTQQQLEKSYSNFLLEVDAFRREDSWLYVDYMPAGANAPSLGGMIFSPEEVRYAQYKYENQANRYDSLLNYLDKVKYDNLSKILSVADSISNMDDYRCVIFQRPEPEPIEQPILHQLFDNIKEDSFIDENGDEIFSDEVSKSSSSSETEMSPEQKKSPKNQSNLDKRIRINVDDDFIENEANMFLDLTIYSYEGILSKRHVKSYKKAVFKKKHGVPLLPPTAQLCSHPMYYF